MQPGLFEHHVCGFFLPLPYRGHFSLFLSSSLRLWGGVGDWCVFLVCKLLWERSRLSFPLNINLTLVEQVQDFFPPDCRRGDSRAVSYCFSPDPGPFRFPKIRWVSAALLASRWSPSRWTPKLKFKSMNELCSSFSHQLTPSGRRWRLEDPPRRGKARELTSCVPSLRKV